MFAAEPALRRMSVAVAALALFTACHNRRSAQIATGCWDVPTAGPAGHVELFRAQTPETTTVHGVRLVAVVRWSSDKGTAHEPVPSALAWQVSGTHRRKVGESDALGFMNVSLPDSAGTYDLRFGGLGAQSVQAHLEVRGGYVDTVRVFLQQGGFVLCA
jgi:hypothetical protein